jgi:Flp pilus assembly protein TadG
VKIRPGMKILRGESGQTVVLFAAFMGIVALGFLAFALDTGLLFRQKRMAQSAADAAAFAAAEEIPNGTSAEQSAANAIAKLNGFDTTLATNPATVTLVTPSSGNFPGSTYVQVTVSKPISTVFLGAFRTGMATMPVSATSIAGGGKVSQTCVCLEGTSGQTLLVSNAARLIANGCGVVVNSTSSNAVGVVGAATLDALTLGLVSSTWNQSTSVNNAGSIASTVVVQGITSSCAPTMPPVPTYSGCLPDPGAGGGIGTFVWGPPNASSTICYNGLSVGKNTSKVTLNPGTYVIASGTLHFYIGANGHSNLGGEGVFFYLTGTANLVIDNVANVNLVAGGNTIAGGGTAPTVGAYNGILIYQAVGDTAELPIQGASSTYLNGALFAPSAPITLGNASGASINGGIVASSLTVSGAATLTANASTYQGSLPISAPKLVQ